ncbi:MAG: GNAT family N-acetyltransferase [Planctomycetota bacterium]
MVTEARDQRIVVQRATQGHAEGLTALFLKHQSAESPAWTASRDHLARRLGRLKDRYDALCLVALIDDRPVGFLGATACTPITQASPRAHVIDLVVDPDLDANKVEDRLISRAIEEAKEMGCCGLALAEPKDETAIQRLREHGFGQRRSTLEIDF